jgi:hypothetical protein
MLLLSFLQGWQSKDLAAGSAESINIGEGLLLADRHQRKAQLFRLFCKSLLVKSCQCSMSEFTLH